MKNDLISTFFQRLSAGLFTGAIGGFLCLSTSIAIAENCNIYTIDAERLRCLEVFYESKNGSSSENGKNSKVQSDLGQRRSATKGKTQSEALRKDKPEDVNAILDSLAGNYVQSDQAAQNIKERKQNEEWQKTRLINACATAYCKRALAPYQEAVDQYQGQRNNPAKAEAEAELRWQFRMRANPP